MDDEQGVNIIKEREPPQMLFVTYDNLLGDTFVLSDYCRVRRETQGAPKL